MKLIGYWAVGKSSNTLSKQKVPGDTFVSLEVYETGYFQDLGYQMIPSYIEE